MNPRKLMPVFSHHARAINRDTWNVGGGNGLLHVMLGLQKPSKNIILWKILFENLILSLIKLSYYIYFKFPFKNNFLQHQRVKKTVVHGSVIVSISSGTDERKMSHATPRSRFCSQLGVIMIDFVEIFVGLGSRARSAKSPENGLLTFIITRIGQGSFKFLVTHNLTQNRIYYFVWHLTWNYFRRNNLTKYLFYFRGEFYGLRFRMFWF